MNRALVASEVQTAQLEQLMALYGTKLLRICYMYLKDVQQAEDAVQDTFLKAYKRLASFHGNDAQMKAWLMQIVVNTCKDQLRTAWFRKVDKRVSIEDLSLISPNLPDQDNAVFDEVMALPLKLREVMLLRYYQGLQLNEICDALGLSLSGVQARMTKAKKLLHEKLERWYFDA